MTAGVLVILVTLVAFVISDFQMVGVALGGLGIGMALIARGRLSDQEQDESLTIEVSDSDLLEAALNGNVDTVRLCLDRGVNVNAQNSQGATALFMAAVQNRSDMLKLLLERGADPSIKNNSGRTPKEAADKEGNQDVFSILSEHSRESGE